MRTSSTETRARRRRDVVARDAVPLEQRERLGERLARRPALALVLAAAPDPVVLLGDVGEVEVDGERAQDDGLRLDVERRDRLGERALDAPESPRRPSRASRRMRSSSAVDVLSLLLGEDASEDLAEQADVRAERRVGRRVGGPAHGPTLPASVLTRPGRSASRPGRGPSRPRPPDHVPVRR